MTQVEEQVEAAFQFRGHVTVHLRDGALVQGYLFNRDLTKRPAWAELFLKGSGDPRRLLLDQIARIDLTGEDCAGA